ncbi:MAG: hypothetical protein ACRDQ5_14455 [Sciscionella sp.]
MRVALVIGASAGFGRTAAQALAERGWSLVVDARILGGTAGGPSLARVRRQLPVAATDR